MLRNGTPAPAFTLRDDKNNEHSLKELHGGQPLVLHFFRGEFCPTAWRDLANYNDVLDRFEMAGATFVGISADPPDSLARLRRRLMLQFPLLSDSDFAISALYGVYESDDGEGPPRHAEPALFVIDVDGNIAYSQIQTGPKGIAPAGELLFILMRMLANQGRY